MQFNLKENTDRQNELSSKLPKTLAIPYNSGREVALARKTRNQLFPSAPPANEVNLLDWINYYIDQGDINIGSVAITASNVSYIPLAPLLGENVQVALQELTTLYNGIPDYVSGNGITLDTDTFNLGGIITENTLLEDIDPYAFTVSVDTLSFVGKGTLRLQTPNVFDATTNPLNRVVQGVSSIGNVEYSSFKMPATNGTVGQGLILDADNETLIWSNLTTDTPDHGTLTGLADDDHPQYFNIARGDARYYTETEMDGFLAGKANVSHTHAISDLITTGTANTNTFLRGDGAWTALPVYTANNGLTLTGNNFSLSGTITADDMLLDGDSNDGYFLNFNNFQIQASDAFVSAVDARIQGTNTLKVMTPNVTVTSATVGQVLKLTNTDGTVEFADETGGGGTTYSFTNGLSEAATVAKLGGTLTDALTIIAGSSNDFYFDTVTNFKVIDSTDIEIQGETTTLDTLTSLRLKTPAVKAMTATVGQALRLTNATTGEVDFSTLPTTYLDLTDTPVAMGGFDTVPTVNNLSNALQHLAKNRMYSSIESYLDVTVTALTNTFSYSVIPNDSVILGGVAFQVVTGVITVDFDVANTEKLVITSLLDNTGNKYTLDNQFIQVFIREDTPAVNWISETVSGVDYLPTGSESNFNVAGTLGVPKNFFYKILLTAST